MTEHYSVGSRITTLRESLSLSVADLAERCECDEATIEQLEAGALAPSLAPLIKITRALGVRLGTLLDDDAHVGPIVTRKDAGTTVDRVHALETGIGGGTLDFRSLAEGKTARHMEPFMITVNPSTERQLSAHEGEEFIYVLAGSIEVEYGKDAYILGVGDSIYLDSIVPHQVRGASPSPARILAVVYAPF